MDPGDNIDAESPHVKTDKRLLSSVIESTGDDEALKLLDSRRPFSQYELNIALISACQRGYKNLMYDLLHLGADVRARDSNWNTPLMICAGKGFINMARYLIGRHANINAENNCGDTALILAIGRPGSVEMVKLLLAQPGIHVSHQNREGYTALMKAAEAMDIDVIKLLLDAQKNAAEVLDQITNCRHETAQEIANKCAIGRVVKLLPDDGSDPFLAAVLACDVDSFNMLMDGQLCGSSSKKHIVQHCFQAVFKTHEISGENFSEGEEKIIQRLLECGADVNKFPSICGPLVIATRVGSYNVCQMLLKHAVNLDLPNWRQKYLLTLSAEHGHAQIMELLLKHNPKLAMPDFTLRALHAAMNKGHKDCINVLTKHGAIRHVKTSFTSAVRRNDVMHLKFLVKYFKVVIKRHFSVHAMSNFVVSAAHSGNIDIICLLIEANVNCVSNDKKTPLMQAEKVALIKFLMQKGAVVNKCRKENNQVYSPMNFVLSHYYQPYSSGKERIVEALLELRACVNGKSCGGRTPLLIAVSSKSSKDIVQVLLDHETDVTMTDSHGNNVLMIATDRNSTEIVECLLRHSQVRSMIDAQNYDGLTALMIAVSNKSSRDIVQMLLDHGAHVTITDSHDNNVLMIATDINCTENVECLLQHSQVRSMIDAQNYDGLTALMIAVSNKSSKDIVQMLLDHEAHVTMTDSHGNNVLMIATDRNSTEIVKCLLQHSQVRSMINAQNYDGLTALMIAVSNKSSKDIVQMLLDHEAHVTMTDSHGNNVLMIATDRNSTENVECLLRHTQVRSMIDAQNYDGLTALMISIINYNQVTMKALIDHGADVNVRDVGGNTALLLEISKNIPDLGVLSSLIEAGSDVNYQTKSGYSSLMLSVNSHKNGVKFLVNSGTHVNAFCKKFENETALSLMLRDAHLKTSCVEYLLDHGARTSFLQPVVLLQLIQWRRIIIIPKLIQCGLRPAEIPVYDIPACSIVEHNIPASVTESISPLAMAILTGNDKLASYFVGNLFVTQNDMFRLAHSQQVRQYLCRHGNRLCWLFLYKLTRKPLSLFSMAFLAVQSAVGPARGHEEISTLPLPQPLKDRLGYKVETVPLETTVRTAILDG